IYSTAFNLSIVSSTISGNSAAGVNTAGGIHTTVTSSTLLNSTISGNNSTAVTGNNAGGILGNGTMINCTVTNNSVANPDPAIVGGVGGGFTISNSLVAGNVANTTRPDIGGFFTSNGGNIIGNVGTATGFTATNDLAGTLVAPINPLLGPLQDNGGPTLTHALLNGSPAINNGLVANIPADTFDLDGDLNVAEALPVDQRGGVNLRQRGPAPDSGAFEAFAFEPTITASTTDEDTQSTSGLVVSANTADGGLTTHYKITGILNGTLFQNDGTTPIAENDYITLAQGAAGLKFTPGLNLNNITTPLFGFTVQAAVGTTTPDLRGATVSTTISVAAVNDAPTVVAPGIPDQTAVVGLPAVVVPLGAHFADVDLDTLTFSVTGNTDPTKATAVLTGGTNVTLTALAFGETDVTITADDSVGGTVTDTFRVFARTQNPTANMPTAPGGGWTANPQTGLFDIVVPVRNTTAGALNGFRLTVNFSAYNAVNPSPQLVLYNRTNTVTPNVPSPAYIDFPYPVAVGAIVPVKLSFHTPFRARFPNPFEPGLDVTALQVSETGGPLPAGMTFVPAIIRVNTVGEIILEWPSVVGKWYRIYYSDNMTTWFPSSTPIQASITQMRWSDTGAPFTQTPPGASRFYQITEIPAPAAGPPP
ncbi:MAG: hypothetical protein JNG86_07600, partial [Verrucomicrobiaceae bacterium]|nr:hypothetical protein [Verrucomicrobiaceae bacterium]